ncbi:MAG: restriction endonuclease subunit S [Muribaculaceae bacterium]|nr:restriction endonuclease subunit S [Muribaculaceae bacterium]
MNHGWEKKRLGEVCKVVGGATPKTNVTEYWDGPFNWVTPAELHGNKYFADSERKITSEGAKSANLQILPIGTVLLSSRAPIGKVAITTEPTYCNQGFKNLICGENVYNEYLYYYLGAHTAALKKEGSGTTFKEISKTKTEQFQILLPPLQCQHAIASELDKLNELIEIKRNQLKDLDTLAQSLFYETFGEPFINSKGWLTNSFGELASSINYGTSLPATDGGKYPYIRMNNLTDNGYLDLLNLKYIDIPDTELDKCLVKKGDILFNRTNSREKVGKTALFDRNEDMVIAGYIIRVRAKSEILNPVFAVRYMNLPEMKEHLRKICRGAVNQANINSKEMSSIPFLVPPIELQNEFATKIEAIEEQKRLIESSIADLETLLASRMDYWFNE